MVNVVSFQKAVEGGNIRKTDDNKISVIDLVAVMTPHDKQNAAHTFANVQSRFPEVCKKITHFQFPGQGQRPTPVADAETAIRIMMLLPGKRAAEFRAEAAKLILAYLNADPTLADDILQRTNEEGQAWLANRASAVVGRKVLTNAIKAAGITDQHFYQNVSKMIYKALLGKTSTQLKEERGVQDVRAAMSLEELNALEFVERALAGKLKQLAGYTDSKEIYQVLKKMAYEIAEYSQLSTAAATAAA